MSVRKRGLSLPDTDKSASQRGRRAQTARLARKRGEGAKAAGKRSRPRLPLGAQTGTGRQAGKARTRHAAEERAPTHYAQVIPRPGRLTARAQHHSAARQAKPLRLGTAIFFLFGGARPNSDGAKMAMDAQVTTKTGEIALYSDVRGVLIRDKPTVITPTA